MTELDFDELDKAVNNLMGDTEESTVPVSSSSDSAVSPVVENVSTGSSSTVSGVQGPNTIQKTITAPLAAKRRGQFMDVIRTSSNGKSNNSMIPKRSGVTVTPTGASVSPTPEVETTSSFSPNDTPPVQPIDFEVTKSEWPDPIDLANSSERKEQTGESEKVEIIETAETKNDEIEYVPAVDTTDTVTPLDSPFLADAKPDKRPLGVPQPAVDPSPMDGALEEKLDIPDSEMTPPVVLPPELHDNVISVETDTTIPEEVPHEKEEPETVPETTPEVVPQKPVETSTANGSIPQQYKEEKSTGDQTNGSIYDTSSYHKAIEAHATSGKRSSVLKWIIWTLLLLVVGAGGGAAYFLLTR